MLIDYRNLKWSNSSKSRSTGGMLLKSRYVDDANIKHYCKLSSFNSSCGVYGTEAIIEVLVSNLLDILNIPHVKYTPISTEVCIAGKIYNTVLCDSVSYNKKNFSECTIETFMQLQGLMGGDTLDRAMDYFGREWVETVVFVDYLILNRDRHGANINIVNDLDFGLQIPVPLFDHGCSLYSPLQWDKSSIDTYNNLADMPVNNYLGSMLLQSNLVNVSVDINRYKLTEKDYPRFTKGLRECVPEWYLLASFRLVMDRLEYAKELLNGKV